VTDHGWRLHAFAVMTNHEHLLVETPEANLSAGMHFLNVGYTQYVNVRYRRRGHIFQGRYKAHLVNDGRTRAVAAYVARRGLGYRRGEVAWA